MCEINGRRRRSRLIIPKLCQCAASHHEPERDENKQSDERLCWESKLFQQGRQVQTTGKRVQEE
jgi:hypothetical protein